MIPILVFGAFFSGMFYGSVRLDPQANTADLLMLDQSQGTMTGTFTGEYKLDAFGGIRLYLTDHEFHTASQTIKMPGRIYCRIKNPSVIPEPEQIYQAKGIFKFSPGYNYPIFIADNLEHGGHNNLLRSFGGKAQRKIRDGLNAVLSRRHVSIVSGFLIGDTSLMTKEDRKLFKKTGVSHLLAISGQHIMLLSMFLAACLHLVSIPPISRSILICIFLITYSSVTLASTSILRALIMYIAAAITFHSESFPSPIRIVSIAALSILLLNPNSIFSSGFILSFTAVISIIILRPSIEYLLKKIKLHKTIARYIAVTFAANIGIMPISAYLFGAVATASIFINPMILWMFALILPMGFVVSAFSIISPEYGLLLSPILSLALDGLLAILEMFSTLPGIYIETGQFTVFPAILAYAILLLAAGHMNNIMIQNLSPKKSQKNDPDSGFNFYRFAEKILFRQSTLNYQKPESSENSEYNNVRAPSSRDRKCNSVRSSQQKQALTPPLKWNKNIFRKEKLLQSLDSILVSTKRRPIKNCITSNDSFPITILGIENQNLYHQLCDLDMQTLKNESFRLIQAQVFLLALAGREILFRLPAHLNPQPDPSEIKIDLVIRDKYLAVAVIANRIFSPSILTRIENNDLMLLISRGQELFRKGGNQLAQMIEKPDQNLIDSHFQLRKNMLQWCKEFITFDIDSKNKNFMDKK
jgi:ComEC/Rec2-related protein